MKIIIGSDHRGFELKENIKKDLLEKGFEVIDKGATTYIENDDYPEFAKLVCDEVLSTKEKGVLLCGSGVGVDITANKIAGVRSCLAIKKEQVESARKDDDVNVLCIASNYTFLPDAIEFINTFVLTPFESNENHQRRLKKITELESSQKAV